MSRDPLRNKDAFLHLVYDLPEGCEKKAKDSLLSLSQQCRHCDKPVTREDADVIVGY